MESNNSEDKKLYLEILNKIVVQVKETQECVTKLDKKLDLNIQEVKHELAMVHKLDERQNELLAEHIKRTEMLEHRMENVESPLKLASGIKSIFVFISAVSAAVYSIGRFFKWF